MLIANAALACILINFGTNDIVLKSGKNVAADIISTVNRIKVEHPETKVVLSYIVPFRTRDQEVIICNEEMLCKLSGKENVFFV